MSFGSRLKERREAVNLTQKDLGVLLGVSGNAIGNYEKGISSPNADALYKVFDILHCDANYLFQDEMQALSENTPSPAEMEHIKKYRALDEHGKDIVDTVLEKELARVREPDNVVELPQRKPVPLFDNSFAAGWGEPDFGNFWGEEYEVPADSPAEFAIRISGDSMEPYIPDGSIALCRKTAPKDGDVGAFLIDGEFVCKQVCIDFAGDLHLFSLNRARKDMDRHYRRDDIEHQVICFGSVIMDKRVPLPLD